MNLSFIDCTAIFFILKSRGPDRQPPDDPGDPRVYPDPKMVYVVISSVKLKVPILKSRGPDRQPPDDPGDPRVYPGIKLGDVLIS